MANSTRATMPSLVADYYEKRFLLRAETNTVFEQLGTPGRIPKGRGDTVVWNRFTNPTAKTSALTEGTDPTPTGLSATLVSAQLSQYGNYESVTDLLELTGVDGTVKAAIDLLAYEAAVTMDTVIRNVVDDGGTALYASGVAARNSLIATDIVQVKDIRKAVRTLHTFGAMPHTKDRFVGVAHPDVVFDLQGDTNWVNAHVYTTKGIDAVYNGEVGELYGVKFMRSNNSPVLTASGSVGQSVDVYQTFIMGKDFYGVSKLQNLTTYVDSPSRNSVLRLRSDVGWKAAFATAVLNDSFGIRLESAATQ